MSNTYRDKKNYLRKNIDYLKDTERIEYTAISRHWVTKEERVYKTYFYLKLPTTKPKKRKEVDTEWHWMTTPGWYINQYMNRPQRRAGHVWEHTILREVDLEDSDIPNVGRKPHIYFW